MATITDHDRFLGPEEVPDVPQDGVGVHLFGTGTLGTNPEGFGVVNGRPYGTQLETERRETAALTPFSPAARARMRRATRAALGR